MACTSLDPHNRHFVITESSIPTQDHDREHGERLGDVERARDALAAELVSKQERIDQLQAQLVALEGELAVAQARVAARPPDAVFVDVATSANSSGMLLQGALACSPFFSSAGAGMFSICCLPVHSLLHCS